MFTHIVKNNSKHSVLSFSEINFIHSHNMLQTQCLVVQPHKNKIDQRCICFTGESRHNKIMRNIKCLLDRKFKKELKICTLM